MANPIAPYLINSLVSNRLKELKRRCIERYRKYTKQPHLVTVYLRINDPYSYLLIQVLQQLRLRYAIEYDFRTVLNLQPDMYPAPELWQTNAFTDSQYLAKLYSLNFPEEPPRNNPQRDAKVTAQLLHQELQPGYLEHALELFEAYWNNNTRKINRLINPTVAERTECYDHHRQANETLLQDSGHYLSGMLHYGKEWYWGLDRLEHLEQRFNQLHLNSVNPTEVKFNLGHTNFCHGKKPCSDNQTPINIFWSLRSPYSYLALMRAQQLAAHYQVPLMVKPVLPMVMRRMQVPKTKGLYILHDVKREANKYQLDFGLLADPLGSGVERCYALYQYAQSQGLGIEFLDSVARGVWTEGIAADTDAGLKKLVERAGLDWQQAQGFLSDDNWRTWAQDNLLELYSKGLWGVPSLSYGDLNVFGQDRLDCIEQAIVEQG